MNHNNQLWGFLAVVFTVVLLASVSWAEPVVFPQGCSDCHGSTIKYPVRGARSQYMTSGHKTLGNASYANSDDCQGCHTNEGFIEQATKGKAGTKKFIASSSEIGCFTCHAPHETGNFSLRKTDKVTLANGVIFDREKANLCANCHQARRNAKDEVKARTIPSDSWGAHHGPQSDMLLGTNGYEFPGKSYGKSAHAFLPKANCVTCHMTLPAGRYSFSPAIGGHSCKLEGEVHEQPTLNVAGCLASGCHKEMKQVKGTVYFDRKAPADYDGDGKIKTIEEEIQGLCERIINKNGTGLLQKMKDAPYDAKGKFINNKIQYPIEVTAALYNYKFVLEDGSKGIHNTTYAVQLLMDSIKALDKGFDDSGRPQ